MEEVIKKVKGFVNKKGDKFELEPSAHTHPCSEILGLNDKIKEYDSDIADVQSSLSNFALKQHSHNSILEENTNSSVSISKGVLNISLYDPDTETIGETDITADNIYNLKRAISDPDINEPRKDSNALITSGAVYNALNDKANISHIHSSSESWLSTLLEGKANSSHNHIISQVTGLEARLSNIEARISQLENISDTTGPTAPDKEQGNIKDPGDLGGVEKEPIVDEGNPK